MQNRGNTLEERLQIINDYIQRTIDALQATRQVVHGLSSSSSFNPMMSGLNHSGFSPMVPTPYGFVTNPSFGMPQNFAQSPYMPNPYGYGYGLSHTGFVPQMSNWGMGMNMGMNPNWSMAQQYGMSSPFGMPHYHVPGSTI